MASTRKKTEEIKPVLRLNLPVNDARQKIEARQKLGASIKNKPVVNTDELRERKNEYYTWTEFNTEMLRQMFTNSDMANEYAGIFGFGGSGNHSLAEEVRDLHEDIDDKIRRLDSIANRLELIPLSPDVKDVRSTQLPETQLSNDTVFLVHGHDEGARESVARFLEKLRLKVVILNEQANEGRTVIEKLEHYSSVGFAVVLLTPDDEGRSRAPNQELKTRARQNVIMELGYFLGKLTRKRVIALYKGVDELPSDFLGVVYQPLDAADGWKFKLAMELKKADYPVDMNDVVP